MLAERCTLQARQALFEPAAGALLISLSALLLQPRVSADQILPWCLLLAATFFLRTVAAARFLTRRQAAEAPQIVAVFSLTSGLTGLLIGACAGLFFPQIDHGLRLALTIVIFAWLAAAVLLHAAFARHALLHGGAVLAQLAAAWALTPDVPGVLIAAGVLVYGALLARLATQLTATLGETIRRRHQVRHLARRLAHERKAALRTGDSSARLLATASHDLRQPATSLGLLSALLKERCSDDGLMPLINGIERSASTLNDLLTSLLDLSRLQSGTVTVQREWLSVSELFEGLRQEFEARAREQGLELIVSPAPLHIECDRVLITRALRNLLDNALRYTDRGAVTLSAADESGCVLSVTDTGIGISPEHLDRIFDEHVRLNTAGRPAAAGLGLGLAIVRRIADLISARIVARSDGRRGSRFELILRPEHSARADEPCTPPRRESLQTGNRGSGAPAAADHESRRTGARLLLVDDDPEVASALSQTLIAMGWQTETAQDARKALARLNSEGPWEALITDFHLGDGDDGLALALAARLLQPQLTCLLLSADTSSLIRQRAREHSLAFFTKPVSPKLLIAALPVKPLSQI